MRGCRAGGGRGAGAGEERVPRACVGMRDTDLESSGDELGGVHVKQEKWLLAALARMTALRSVRWACSHSLVGFEGVWAALVRGGGVCEVEVEDNVVFQPDPEEGDDGEEGEDGRAQTATQLVVRLVAFPTGNYLTA